MTRLLLRKSVQMRKRNIVIFLLLVKQFLLSIRISQLDSRLRILTEQVALNQEKQEREKMYL